VNRFSKITKTLNLMAIRSVGDEFSHADRRTVMAKLTAAFCNFTNSPEKDEKETNKET
jgi:hypothetical protein